MTPARSVAASVIALGFVSSFTAPAPAFAAPAPCEKAENYAAQSGAEMLRIDQLDWHRSPDPDHPSAKPSRSSDPSPSPSPSGRTHGDPTDSTHGGSSGRTDGGSSGRTHGNDESTTDPAGGRLTSGVDPGASGKGVTGFLSGTGDLVKSVTNGGVTALGSPLSAAGGGSHPSSAGGGSHPSSAGGGGHLSSAGAGSRPSSAGGGGRLSSAGGGGRLGSAGSGGQGGGGPVSKELSGGSSSTSASPSTSASTSVAGVGLGETKTAMIADARTNAIAVGRIVDGEGPLSKPLIQSAPPNSADSARHTPSSSAGPLDFSGGDLNTHAVWNPAMACGKATGEVARSSASLKHADLANLFHVSKQISSQSSTELSRDKGEPRSAAAATLEAGRLTLADGKIKLQVIKQPTLTASMGATRGGEVDYQPPTVKVTWPGGRSKTLTAAGDSVDISLGNAGRSAESTSLGALNGLRPTSALPMPSIPGLPSVAAPDAESAPAVIDGVTVRVSLGDVRRATKASAIAAKATAIKIAISEGCADDKSSDKSGDKSDDRGKDGYGDVSPMVIAQMSVGLLEVAAAAPEAAPGRPGPGGPALTSNSTPLPITGPQAGLIAAGGLGLLLVGGAAILAGRRRRRTVS